MSALWVLNPILAMYGFGTISLFDIFLLLFLPVGLLTRLSVEDKVYVKAYYSLFIFSILLSALFNISEITDTYLRSLRLLLYLFSLFLFSTRFDIYYGKTLLKYLAFLSSIYLIYQYLAYHYLGFYPKGFVQIPGIEILRQELIDHAQTPSGKLWFRPRSIFGEPSQFAIVVGLYLCIEQNIKFVRLLFLIFALFLSGSGLGFAVILLVLFFKASIRLRTYLFITAIIAFFLLSIDSPIFNDLIKRGGRRLIMFSELSLLMSPVDMIFGKSTVGPDDFSMWPNGMVLNFYYFGMIGLLMWFLFLLNRLREMYVHNRNSTLFFFLMLVFSTELIVSQLLLFILPFIAIRNENSLDN